MTVCLSVCLSVCPSVYVCVCLCVDRLGIGMSCLIVLDYSDCQVNSRDTVFV